MSKTYNLLCPKCGYTMKFTKSILDEYDKINPPEFQCPECCEMIKKWREKLVFVDTEEIQRKEMEYARSDAGRREYFSRYSSLEEYYNDRPMTGLHDDDAYLYLS